MAEVFLAFRNPVLRPITQARSTIIVAGIQTLRAHNLFSQYLTILTPGLREELLGLVAGMWIPIDLALEHYRAADRLNIDPSTIEAIGGEVADRTYKSWLAPLLLRAKRADSTPWDTFAMAHENNDLTWKGGDTQILKEGPKQALYEWVGQPLASVPYFVRSFSAFMRALLNVSADRVYQRLVTERCSPTAICLRFTWS